MILCEPNEGYLQPAEMHRNFTDFNLC